MMPDLTALRAALKIECSCRSIETCDRCEALNAIDLDAVLADLEQAERHDCESWRNEGLCCAKCNSLVGLEPANGWQPKNEAALRSAVQFLRAFGAKQRHTEAIAYCVQCNSAFLTDWVLEQLGPEPVRPVPPGPLNPPRPRPKEPTPHPPAPKE